MDSNLQKEQFSYAYVRAVATVAGCAISESTVDDDSIDLNLRYSGRWGGLWSPQLDMQVKCSAGDILRDDGVHFPLLRKNYDDLRQTDVLVPRILVVVLVPHGPTDWLEQDEDRLALRKCGYWMSLMGREDIDQANKTVILPRGQVFSIGAITNIFDSVARGETP